MVIKFFRVLTCLVVTGLAVSACSSSDDDSVASDPVAACKQLFSTLCDKYYNCYTDAELKAASAVVGNNKADCVDKLAGQCNVEAKCDSGKTYHADKAQACLSSYKAFSCDEIRGFENDTTQAPASCDQVCSN